jgi:hypothetical protein
MGKVLRGVGMNAAFLVIILGATLVLMVLLLAGEIGD